MPTKKSSKPKRAKPVQLPPAHACRKHQKRPVTVVNLFAEDSIKHAMLGTLAADLHKEAEAQRKEAEKAWEEADGIEGGQRHPADGGAGA